MQILLISLNIFKSAFTRLWSSSDVSEYQYRESKGKKLGSHIGAWIINNSQKESFNASHPAHVPILPSTLTSTPFAKQGKGKKDGPNSQVGGTWSLLWLHYFVTPTGQTLYAAKKEEKERERERELFAGGTRVCMCDMYGINWFVWRGDERDR